mmetsp:Transcript_2225/g.3410  ORF Transcript_2225/g.3410 Transcript_2225/m.3410 type:complete len:320 (-) Transcript_2225:83-1042(-)
MTSTTKRKHSETFNHYELYGLCFNTWYNDKEEGFDSIRQWLNTNKDEDDRFKAAITYQGGLRKRTPLHLIFCISPPLDIILTIFKYSPEVFQMKDMTGKLPIHDACWSWASLEVMQVLITASPDSIKVEDNDVYLPLHWACLIGASLDVLNFLIESYPEGIDHKDNRGKTPMDLLIQEKYAKKKDDNGMLLLHHACNNGYSDRLFCFLIQAYPESVRIKDNHGRTPLHYYTSFQGRQPCNEITALLQPVMQVSRNRQVNVNAPLLGNNSDRKKRTEEVDEIKTQVSDTKQEFVSFIDDIKEIKTDIAEIKSLLRQIVSG